MVDPSNVEDCHWIKPSKGTRKVTVKFSRHKNANMICLLKKGLKGMNLSSLGINSAVYIKDYVPITKCCGVNVENFY